MHALASILAVAGAASCLLTGEAELSSETRALRLRDLMALECVAPADRASLGDTIILEAPTQRDEIHLSRQALANLVRRRIPALGIHSLEAPDERVLLRFNAHSRSRRATHASPASPASIQYGDALTLHVAIGPVSIARTVTAMQSAKSDGDVFVRSDDGEVFSLPLTSLRPAGTAQ